MTACYPIATAAARVLDRLAIRAAPPPGIEVWDASDRAAWLERRQQDVTASTAGALLGVHAWITAYELGAMKKGLIADPEETKPMQAGRLLEDDILQVIAEERPTWAICQPGRYYRDPAARIGATPDAFARDPERKGFGIIQVKLVDYGDFRDEWLQGEEIEPPLWIAVQALVENHLTGADWAAVAAGYVKRGLHVHLIDIPLHAGLIDRIKAEVAAFWRTLESGRLPDPDYGRDGAALFSINAPNAAMPAVDLSADNTLPDVVARYEQAGALIKYTSSERDRLKAEIIHRLGGATVGLLADGRKVTWTMLHRDGHRVPPSSAPVLRIVGKPAGIAAGADFPASF